MYLITIVISIKDIYIIKIKLIFLIAIPLLDSYFIYIKYNLRSKKNIQSYFI